MYKKNIQILQKKINYQEAYFITNKYNIRYLCGYTGTNGYLLLTKNKSWFFTDTRYLAEAKKIIAKGTNIVGIEKQIYEKLKKVAEKNKIKIIYFEGNDIKYSAYVKLKKNLKNIKPQTDFVENLRTIKKASEIRAVIKAQRIAEKIFLTIQKSLRANLTEKQIAWEIEKKGHDCGADGLSFHPIVAFGTASSTPHHQNSNRKLKKGDLILIDMGVKYKGYCSDMTRIIFTSNPTTLQKKIYNLVLQAQETAISKIKEGMSCKKADAAARNLIKKAGYGKKFLHSLGHGVGMQIHENPLLSALSDQNIPVNSIITIEPGIYLENKFGIRIEDMILVTPKGISNLTKMPKILEKCIIRLN